MAETALLLAALDSAPGLEPLRGLEPAARPPVEAALQRAAGLPDDARRLIGEALRARLAEGARAPVAPLHPAWLNAWRRREPQLIAHLRGEPMGSPEVAAWLGGWAGHTFGVLDPRHPWEHQRGEVLELDQLALAAREEGVELLQTVGRGLVASALRGTPRRQQALQLAALSPGAADRLLEHLRNGEDFPELLGRATRGRLLTLELRGDALDGLTELGILALSAAVVGRHQHLQRPLRYALPPELEPLLKAHVERAEARQAREGAPCDPAAACLAALQLDARQGHLRTPFHARRRVTHPGDAAPLPCFT